MVRTINYKGKAYVQVVDRVQEVHNRRVDFEVIDSDFFEIRGRVLCKAKIKVDGKQYTGTAEVKLENAVPKSADATNPFECGETSAVGRALAWAGYGSADSIASFDEIARSMDADELKQVLAGQPAANNRPASANATAASQQRPASNKPAAEGTKTAKAVLWEELDKLKPVKKNGQPMTRPEALAYIFKSQILARQTSVEHLVQVSEYTADEQLLIQEFIDQTRADREAAASKKPAA